MSADAAHSVVHREHQPIVWWAWAIIAVIAVETAWTLIAAASSIRDGGVPSSTWVTLGVVFAALGLISLFLTGNRAIVRPDGVEVWVAKWPIPVRIPIATIRACRPVSYRPLRKFGGWGVRGSFSGIRAYTARGNLGLLLYLDNGRTLIGSDDPERLARALASVGVERLAFSDNIDAPME